MKQNYPSTVFGARVVHGIRLLLLVMILMTTTTMSAVITSRTVRGAVSTSRVGVSSTSVASTQESTGDGTDVDDDVDDSYGDGYDEDELDTGDDDVEELKVGVTGKDDRNRQQQQQPQQQYRRRDQHQQPAVVTVRRETNDEMSPHGTGGSVRSTFAGAPIMVSESRVRVGAGDQAAHDTSSVNESAASSDSAVGISREQWIERER